MKEATILLVFFCLSFFVNIKAGDIFKLLDANDINSIEHLISVDKSVLNSKNKDGVPLLFCAIFKSKFEVVSLLLNYGVAPDQEFVSFGVIPTESNILKAPMITVKDTYYPLPSIIDINRETHPDLNAQLLAIEKTITKGASLRSVNKTNNLPTNPSIIFAAATRSEISVLKLLLIYNTDVNYTSVPPVLPLAYVMLERDDKRTQANTKHDRALIFFLLLKHGVEFDPKMKNKDGIPFLDMPHNKEIKTLYEKTGSYDDKIKELDALREPIIQKIKERIAKHQGKLFDPFANDDDERPESTITTEPFDPFHKKSASSQASP